MLKFAQYLAGHRRVHLRFAAHRATRDYKVPGAGPGLVIAQTIMQRLNGRLSVDSQPGQGVTFTLSLR
jgi:signal transduction histidine kinase